MFDLILLPLFFAWRNSIRARMKGQNGFVWGFITFLIFEAFEMIGFTISVLGFYHVPPTKDALSAFVSNPPMASSLFVLFCGLGGYLLIRFILDRMSGKRVNNGQQE
ncbi:hypothetical protein [Taibaiella soli]|uniref:Uncharacterized protein n=1 Tax=Taibaiella soli TaxID=1649169 RepID=A0A2W2BCC4_9BACT|nr:hypothetical protein [Taibaiella soli]PZF71316.1 hypothetical protein DN068_18645 [Taibaiella soli]